jgi:hypothetical protein
MTRTRLIALLVGVLVASCAVPASTGAQNGGGLQLIGGGAPVSLRAIPVHFTGQLVVAFHGDAASGCASRGLCGYAGTVSWRPPSTGAVEIFTERRHGRLSSQFELLPGSLNSYPGPPGGVTTANVQLSNSPPLAATLVSSCVDATNVGNFFSLPVEHGKVLFTLAGAGPTLLSSRCAGPLDGDVMPAIPTSALALGAVLRGRTTVALAGSRSFASHGFAGTVQSTLTIALGRPGRTQRAQTGNPAPGFRQIQVRYRATLSGSVVEHVSGSADPAICTPLGSCGSAGTLTLTPGASGLQANLTVLARARTPYRDLLAAVGLARGRAGKALFTTGAVTWKGGTVAAELGQGSTTCRDTAPLGPGGIILQAGGGRLQARYLSGFGALGTRTRCPGPAGTIASSVATAAIPVSQLARRTITISLTKGSTFSDYGYQVRAVPDLTLTLTRVGVRKVTKVNSAIGINVSGSSSSSGSGSSGTFYAP